MEIRMKTRMENRKSIGKHARSTMLLRNAG